MNQSNRGPPVRAPGADQSALSLLVNAADSRENPQRSAADARLAETLRLRGLAGAGGVGGGEPTLEEQLLLQQQAYGGAGGSSLLFRDQNILAQLGQQQHLASLLGLGGGGGSSAELRQALAAAQLRQNQAAAGLTQADILALSRSGALSGILGGSSGLGAAGAFAGGGGASAFGSVGGQGLQGASGRFASELEGLQRLEELNLRNQGLLASASENPTRPGIDRSAAQLAAGIGRESNLPDSPARSAEASRNLKPEGVPAQEGGKEGEIEKTPGSVIVPCRARGMPMDHNFKTAYFVIPENVKHGEELICSYFACRNAGIKFRYCSHCKVPVAKRNFRKRHKHGGDIAIKGDDSGGEEDLPKKGIPSQITASREEAAEADGISSQSADSMNQQENQAKISYADMQQGLVRNSMRTFRNSMRTFESAKNKNKSTEPISTDQKISSERQARWVSLLGKRPSTKDSDTMSAWLMEVLAVSDLDTPLKPGDFPAPDSRAAAAAAAEAVANEDAKKESNEKESGKKKSSKEMDSPKVGSGKRKSSKEVDSPRSDAGYGSSNDSSGDNEKPKEVEKKKEKPAATFNGGIVKKKRPNDTMRDEGKSEGKEKKKGDYVSGSFAEWKERKKQRKAASNSNSNGN